MFDASSWSPQEMKIFSGDAVDPRLTGGTARVRLAPTSEPAPDS